MRFANGLLNWKQGVVNTAIQPSSTPLLPNNRLQPTASSVRSFLAAAFGSGCGAALVRQAQLGASCRVQVPAEEGLTNHSYRVLQLRRRCTTERSS